MAENNVAIDGTGTEGTEGAVGTEESKTYTHEQVMSMLQSESDRRVTEALKKQQKKYEKQIQNLHSLEGLDASEREKQQLANENAELKELIAQYTIEKNRSELKSVLGSRGLSPEFCDIITITDDIEASQANIDKLDKLIKEAVKAQVEAKLRENGGAPKAGALSVTEGLTKEQAMKLSVAEMMALKNDKPELYKQFFN